MIRKAISVLIAGTALLVAPVALRPAANSPANSFAANLGRGEIVGRVVHRAGTLSRHLQVLVDGQQWTLNVPNGVPVTGAHGYPYSVHSIHNGTYVRAEGTRTGPTRVKAYRVYVIGDRLAMARAGYPRIGYYASFAGYRSRYGRVHRRHR